MKSLTQQASRDAASLLKPDASIYLAASSNNMLDAPRVYESGGTS